METATVETRPATGRPASATIADLLPGRGAEPRLRAGGDVSRTTAGEWTTRSFAEVGEIGAPALARPDRPRGSRRATRSRSSPTPAPSGPTSTSPRSRAGATVVPIYQTNSPEECQYVLENSDAKVVIVEDDEQLEKIRAGPRPLPEARARDPDDRLQRRRDLRRGARPSAAPRATTPSGRSAGARSRPTTSARSSTPRAPPGRRRAASSATATTARCSTWSTEQRDRGRATSPTSTCRSPTPSPC